MEFFGEVLAWFADPANWTDARNGIPLRLWEHISLSAVALALARGHRRCRSDCGSATRGAARRAVIAIANIGRAVPSLGWLGIVVPDHPGLLGRGGLGFIPAVIALVALGIPPIVTNTYVGLREVDPDLVEAGARDGDDASDRSLRRVEVPVALPVILAGVRVSAVQMVATATLAAVVGGGTLGDFIMQGIDVRDAGARLRGRAAGRPARHRHRTGRSR